ncbi:Cupin domain-containing protein [Solirubrobacter pauli]|uniref:Cupin domain-containing protein n=1 Tax=Solirubrobacter pauli TaxID=166793 RepID=A0A660LK59_9ACTN|nr:cupin domain-containing protein [Solirubrobacter pauli]RKQ93591.1 Cupin domain-containing protein [Solirubrobacter pauli]
MTSFHRLDQLTPTQAFPGISFRHVHGEQLTFSVFELEPDAELPRHSHHNEQAGLCTRGSLTFSTADGDKEVGPGEIWMIPAHEEHGGRSGPDGATVVEVFAPAREDWPR